MTSNGNNEKVEESYKGFEYFPYFLYDEALKILRRQFNSNRAGHIKAVALGRGNQLQAINEYVQTKKIAVHEAGHVMAIWYGGSMNTVDCATIRAGWMHYHMPEIHINPIRKYPLCSQADFFEDMCFCLSGRIAESMFFPEDQPHFPYFMNYPESDIHKAINLAYHMAKIDGGFAKDSQTVTTDLVDDVTCYLIRAYEATTQLLKNRVEPLLKVAIELLANESLTPSRLLTILGNPKKPFMSLYDKYCAFSMTLRSLPRRKYCLSRPKRSKKVAKRKKSRSSRKKKSKALTKQSKKTNVGSTESRKRKKSTNSKASKKRLTNSGQVVTVN